MLGTVRLILALMVALSHVGWYPGINPGVVAVVVFYMISGYAMASLWHSLQKKSTNPLTQFAWDRFWRIYPPYFIVLVATAALVVYIAPQSYFLSAPSWQAVIQNILIVPLNYYMFSGVDRYTLIPPAWSLAVELQFYLLLPILLLRWPRFFYWLSLVIAVVAQIGWLPREWFTYRLLPGVLHLFLAGVLLAQADNEHARLRLALKMFAMYSFLFLMAWLGGDFWVRSHAPGPMFNLLPELALGVMLGLPILALLAPLREHALDKPHWRLAARTDTVLGYLSYSAFLVHFGVYWWLTRNGPEFDVTAFLALTLLLAAIVGFGVEYPTHKIRKRSVISRTVL